VLEATPRVGGRVCTVRTLGADAASDDAPTGALPIELGATFVHGRDAGANIIAHMAYESGALGPTAPRAVPASRKWAPAVYARADGSRLPQSSVRAALNRFDEALDECDGFFREGKAVPHAGATVADYIVPRWQSLYGPEPAVSAGSGRVGAVDGVDGDGGHGGDGGAAAGGAGFATAGTRLSRADAWDVLSWRQRLESCVSGGGTLADLDLASFGEYAELPGGDAAVRVGYDRIVRRLQEALPTDAVRTSAPVRRVCWGGDAHEGDGRVRLELEDGSTVLCRVAIVTAPLGVLKQSCALGAGGAGGERPLLTFEPPLPADKAGAIGRLGFGAVDKVVVEFADDADVGGLRSISCVWADHDRADVGGEGDAAAGVLAAEAGLPRWARGVCSFWRDPVTPCRWTCWMGGADAAAAATESDETIASGIVAVMRAFAGRDVVVPEPRRVLRSKWAALPTFLGSYSFVAAGASGDEVDTASSPLGARGQVRFAGEHTSREYYSTAHGAVLSGIREARRALRGSLGVATLRPELWVPTTTAKARQERSEQDE